MGRAARGSELSPQSQRHLLGLLSRFFSWCIERGLQSVNNTFDTIFSKDKTAWHAARYSDYDSYYGGWNGSSGSCDVLSV